MVNLPNSPRGTTRCLSVAPMMDRTDRHFRYLMRQISKKTLLYSEMVTTGAILRGDTDKHLRYNKIERPLVLQLGGDKPQDLATCAKIAADYGYDEVNLNVGCPSDRVQEGRFGACLMAEPMRVADAVSAMRSTTAMPVTVKHRIGIDHHDSYEFLAHFVGVVREAGCDRFTVHARVAILSGLSPKDNRRIPPLRYEDVYRLKREFPTTPIEINGGIVDLDRTLEHLQRVDAVMIGRGAYDNPYRLAQADRRLFSSTEQELSRLEVVKKMEPYIAQHLEQGGRLHSVTRHMLNLFAGEPGARQWRRHLSQFATESEAGLETLRQALQHVSQRVA